MKKLLLILIIVLITTNVYAHSTKGHTPNLDSRAECKTKKSGLNFISKHKLWPSMEAVNQSMQNEPQKAFKKMFKVFKGEKCIEKGVTIGGKHMDEYMPQFMNFFKENLL